MNTGENNRDYKKEYERRKKRNKRLIADMDRTKAEAFQSLLEGQNISYIAWLTNKIDEELNNRA